MLVPASFTCCYMAGKSALLSKTMEAWRVPCLYPDYEFVTGDCILCEFVFMANENDLMVFSVWSSR